MERILGARKRIALVAHDHKKDELLHWVMTNKEKLADHRLFATGTTGTLLEQALQLPIQKLLSGPLGGDQQIGAMIAEDKLDILIFFWDPMEAQPHDPDVKALLRLSATYNLPVACNAATADFMFAAPFMTEEYKALQTDYSMYLKRKLPEGGGDL
ncbi:methylglyoxal synthase [Niabella drilacis]|uniref:Methylglyoxal synthase n=1 Tax=Niabella drilacis (strain DSM 25811 / CCM 8410 / CCUG 62505 / LMG 26954 / E90) TaxID=1285928 RepID=A0A1G6PQL1_NIADE|nr:methylglyoxal synthase [Niabella drilacis]SDC81934.1 methylglyoxal synthase [Niabella drilacis]